MILEKTGCDYYIGHHPLPGIIADIKIIEGYEVFFQKLDSRQKNIFLIYDTIKEDYLEKKIKLYLEKDFNPNDTAITEREIELEKPSPENSGEINTIKSISRKKKFLIKTPTKALAVIPGCFQPGWKAWIDGEKTDVFKVNLSSKGIVVPPGEHEVEMKYFPSSFLYGAIISILSVLIISVFLLIKYLFLKT
jgi:uncharacterized membrane protein YfhO